MSPSYSSGESPRSRRDNEEDLEGTPASVSVRIEAKPATRGRCCANSPNRDAGRTRKVSVLIGWKFVGWVNSGWAGRVAAAWEWEWDFGSVGGRKLVGASVTTSAVCGPYDLMHSATLEKRPCTNVLMYGIEKPISTCHVTGRVSLRTVRGAGWCDSCATKRPSSSDTDSPSRAMISSISPPAAQQMLGWSLVDAGQCVGPPCLIRPIVPFFPAPMLVDKIQPASATPRIGVSWFLSLRPTLVTQADKSRAIWR
uniref:Uncharacterized protein n=1 Tax=Coccidioides posadasii RMSCC 3488 TaxID=454284 RepID=A0A0J6FU99_COCPO|nr:hypothetical protein CPAG_08978 [Coccidioides posadasii RMSCC 3488]